MNLNLALNSRTHNVRLTSTQRQRIFVPKAIECLEPNSFGHGAGQQGRAAADGDGDSSARGDGGAGAGGGAGGEGGGESRHGEGGGGGHGHGDGRVSRRERSRRRAPLRNAQRISWSEELASTSTATLRHGARPAARAPVAVGG